MARPIKRTLDYFPHFVYEGKIKSLLEKKLGISGYACYYKIQERLADTDNQYIDLRDELTYEFFIGEINIDEDVIVSTIEYLVKLKYFDEELWSKKILWSERFIANTADAYSKRKTDVPMKPMLDDENNIIGVVSDPFYPVNDSINTQIKGKETKLNKTKSNQNIEKKKRDFYPADFKYDSTGNAQIGYCSSCNISGFYNKNEIWGESKCCNSQLTPERITV